jgi:hypothetical protein
VDLDKIAIRLRQRNSWEGIDLGFAMAREWFVSLWLLWLCSALPVMILLTLLPLSLWLAGLLLWWLKPLYEPPLLFWLSRRVFSEHVSLRDVFKGWSRIVLPQMIAALTWRRLMPSRSFFMPVVVLEGLKGGRRRKRLMVLGRTSHAAAWLTTVGLHFEVILQLGMLGLILVLIPEDLLWTDWQSFLFDPDPMSEWLQHLCALAAMSVIAPFYVAGGFALYLTRRSQIEAWDLELGLRQLAQRHPIRPGLTANLSVVCLCLVLVGLLPPDSVKALELSSQDSQELVQEVLQHQAFGRDEEYHYWRYIDKPEDSSAEDQSGFGYWLGQLVSSLAYVSEILLWIVVGGILAYLIYWYAQNRSALKLPGSGGKNQRQAPQTVLGLDLRPETLPDNPATTAARLIEQGDERGGLALLYRASLSELVHRYALPVREGDTEGECLLRSRSLGLTGLDDYLARLTRVWQRLAYGHQQPDKDQALALCHDWRRFFEVGHV